jgi:hypothetical protein
MPKIFVQGVNTRRDPRYDAQQQITARGSAAVAFDVGFETG